MADQGRNKTTGRDVPRDQSPASNFERGAADANGGAVSDGPKNSQMQQAPSPTGGLELVQQTKQRQSRD